ncbi:hypothetical protein PCE1_001038 [Barthelona sp. PCE]
MDSTELVRIVKLEELQAIQPDTAIVLTKEEQEAVDMARDFFLIKEKDSDKTIVMKHENSTVRLKRTIIDPLEQSKHRLDHRGTDLADVIEKQPILQSKRYDSGHYDKKLWNIKGAVSKYKGSKGKYIDFSKAKVRKDVSSVSDRFNAFSKALDDVESTAKQETNENNNLRILERKRTAADLLGE